MRSFCQNFAQNTRSLEYKIYVKVSKLIYLLALLSGGEAAGLRPERPNNLLLSEHFLRPASSTLA